MTKPMEALKKDQKSGVAMVVVLCASAFFIALSMALMYSASVLLSTANQKLGRERCYQLAKTFSDVVAAELCTKEPVPEKNDLPEDSIFRYANKFLEGYYVEYDPDHIGDTTYSYGISASGDGKDTYGSMVVTLYKELSQGEGETSEGAPPITLTGVTEENLATFLSAAEATRFNDYSFGVQATAGLDKDSYTYTTRYYRTVTYQVEYSLTSSGGVPLYRKENAWYTNLGCTQPYNGQVTSDTLRAQYNVEKILTKQFRREGEEVAAE